MIIEIRRGVVIERMGKGNRVGFGNRKRIGETNWIVRRVWEESDEEGDGNGIFSKVQVGEECESWVAYLMGKKAH